jgi:hypothetical protein
MPLRQAQGRRALSIRQPYAELILRGIKTVEYRSQTTRIIGERFYIYASKKKAEGGRQNVEKMWSEDLSVATPPLWMVELAEQMGMIEEGALLPTGVIVGSAVIEGVMEAAAIGGKPMFGWRLGDVRRAKTLRKPKGHPQPVWFRAF